MSLFGCFLSGLAKAGTGEDQFMQSPTNSRGSYLQEGSGSYLRPWLLNEHFRLLCNVATLALNVAMFQLRDVSTS